MHGSSIFKIKIDFKKSHNSYIYDKNRVAYFLDFFGLYSSLPLGYNHQIFKSRKYFEEYNRIAAIKVPNCEIISDEARDFFKEFSRQSAMKPFKNFYFCCTGALAIEAALKTAIDHKGSAKPVILGLKESFHGINSYGGFITDRFAPVNARLDGFPELGWIKLANPKICYHDGQIDEKQTVLGNKKFLSELKQCVRRYKKENIAALLVEPIQSTYGDNYFSLDFFRQIRAFCDQYGICLIFDEIQTGFGATGTLWYFEQTGIIPDIVVFGKKAQVSGIMVKDKFSKIFKTPIRLEVTWDGNLSDMIRNKYVLRAFNKFNVLNNVKMRSQELISGLKQIRGLKNVRGCGLLVAFDFENIEQCSVFFKKAIKKRFLCNKTRDKTVRLRPNLNVSKAEVKQALAIIKECVTYG